MSKLRHIALSVPDPWAAAEFYMQAFGLNKVGEADTPLAMGVYLSDGTVNIALLKYKTDELAGRAAEAAGAKHFAGEPSSDNTFYEVKYRDPVNGLIFDITAHGWVGATKDGSGADAPRLSNETLQADRSILQRARLPSEA